MRTVIALVLLACAACTDTDKARFSALGHPGHITCWSGTLITLDTESTGRIQTVDKSDGWEFEDARTHKFTRVSGPCVIVN